MKYVLVAFMLFAGISVYCQEDALNELKEWERKYNQANEIYYAVIDLNNTNPGSPEIDDKCKEALSLINESVEHCEKSKELHTRYVNDANLFMVESYLLAAWFNELSYCNKYFTDELTKSYLDKAHSLRPQKTSIPFSSLVLKTTEVKWTSLYEDQVYLCFRNSWLTGNDNDAVIYGKECVAMFKEKYGEDYINIVCNKTDSVFEKDRLYLILTRLPPIVEDAVKPEYYVSMVELYAGFYDFKTKEDKEFKYTPTQRNDILMAGLYCTISLIDEKSDNYSLMRRASKAYSKLGESDLSQSFYTASVLMNNQVTLSELWEYLSKTMEYDMNLVNKEKSAETKKNIGEAADKVYEKLGENASEEEYLRLLVYYDYIGNFSKSNELNSIISKIEQDRQKQEKKERFQQKWGLSVGIAPGKLIGYNRYGQISVHADFKIFGFGQGGRYCVYNQYVDNKRFGAWTVDNSQPGGSNTYSGYEVSYWATVFSYADSFVLQRISIEARYGNYEFNTINASIINRETNLYQFVNQPVNPVGHRADINFVYRLRLWAANRLYVEGDFGFGVGYRWLSSEYDLNKFLIEDIRYGDDRWPSVTLPVRLGLRAGIRIF